MFYIHAALAGTDPVAVAGKVWESHTPGEALRRAQPGGI